MDLQGSRAAGVGVADLGSVVVGQFLETEACRQHVRFGIVGTFLCSGQRVEFQLHNVSSKHSNIQKFISSKHSLTDHFRVRQDRNRG